MALNPGRNVGRLSIRVLPDTKRFRSELEKSVKRVEKTVHARINVVGAKVDRVKVREDIRRQMEGLSDITIDAKARVKTIIDEKALEKIRPVVKIKPTMDRLTVERMQRELSQILKDVEPRLNDRRLRQQLDVLNDAFEKVSGRLANDVLSPTEAEKLRHRLEQIREKIDDIAKDRETKLHVNPFTAWAAARLKWLTRPRTVEIIAKVSKSSIIAALTTLSALSGARLSWKWIDSLIDKFKELDRNLPRILGWTTGITTLIASLFAATSGVVGVGQGLFSILPAMLVLPGLLLNAAGSATALIVALRNSSKELEPLKDNMHELGDIINEGFWGKARKPIIDLVQGLMPQLRTAFHDLSLGIGEFTAAMSQAFGKELANGRLASIFNGIAEGWRVLGSGADGFAGALVSLSNIAATYTPRLAHWFVRQAATFDKWLKAISEDGRLGRWMEDAIDSMYDVWDVTRGLAGVFSGLWKAAEAAGSGGLKGFAELMLTWRRTVHSADFQKGLTAVFRGSYEAMEAFGGAVKGIGRLVSDNSQAFEKFIGSAGKFLGGLIEGIADALNSPIAAKGLNDLSEGLLKGLEKILPSLQPIADTFGNFLGLIGDLASEVLPTAVNVLAELMPGLDSLIDAVRPALPGLAQAVTDIAKELAPAINDLLAALGPAVIEAIKLLADALVALAPVLNPLIKGLADFVRVIGQLLTWMSDGITDLATNKPDAGDWLIVEGAKQKDVKLELDLDAIADVNLMLRDLNVPGDVAARIQEGLINPKTLGASQNAARELGAAFMQKYEATLKEQGQFGADALVEGIVGSDLPDSVKNAIGQQLNAAGYEYDYFKDAGVANAKLFADGLNDGKLSIEESIGSWRESFIRSFEKSGLQGAQALWDSFDGYQQDNDAMQGLLADLRKYGIDIKDEMGDAGGEAGKGLSTEFMNSLRDSDFHLGLRDKGKEAAGGLLEGFLSGVTGGSGGTGGAGGGYSFSRSVALGITQGKPEVKGASTDLGSAIVAAFAGASTMLTPAGSQVSGGLLAGISSGTPAIMSTLSALNPSMQGVFAGARSWLNPQGVAVSGGLADGITKGRGAVVSAVGGLRSAVTGGVSGISLYGTGMNLVGGLAAGIRANSGAVANAARAAVNNAVAAAKNAGEIRSPSRRTAREIGKPLMQGVAVGIEKNAAGVQRSMANAIDLSGVTGKSPELTGTRAGTSGVALHIHNPVVGDLMQDTWRAAQLAGVMA